MPDQGSLCLIMKIWLQYDPTMVDMTSNLFGLCTNVKVYDGPNFGKVEGAYCFGFVRAFKI